MTADPSRLLPEFLLYYLATRYDELRDVARGGGTTKAALTCGYLRRMQVPLAPLDEQREIADLLRALDRVIDVASRREKFLFEFFEATLDGLMSGTIAIRPEAAEAATPS